MNYQKIYDQLIEHRKNNPAIKTDKDSIAEHHILPKSMGGSNDKSNLVILTAKEHFVAHHLLWKIYNNQQMASAFFFMSHIRKTKKFIKKISAKEYSKLKKQISKDRSKRMKNRLVTWETRKRMSQSFRGRKMSYKNRMAASKRLLGKQSVVPKGTTRSEKTKLKISLGTRQAMTKEVCKEVSKRTKAAMQRPEVKQKTLEAQRRRRERERLEKQKRLEYLQQNSEE